MQKTLLATALISLCIIGVAGCQKEEKKTETTTALSN
jgi:hypothetical protein